MTQHEDTTPTTTFRLAPVFGALLFALMVVSIGFYAWRGGAAPWGGCEDSEQGEQGQLDYAKWEKPLAALVLSGQMHGYVDPCGCSEPQYGGLIRRYNFVQALLNGKATKTNQSWNVVGIDLGEFAQTKGIQEQNLLKFRLTVQSLAKTNYRAIGIGADEILMPLGEALAQVWDKKSTHPRPISLSLAQTAAGQLYHDLNVRNYEIIDHTTPKIGVINLMGPDLRDKLDGQEKFLNTLAELPKALKAFADAKVEIGIILHHEYPKVNAQQFPPGFQQAMQIAKLRKIQALECAKFCAAERKKNPKIPPIQLMMLLTELGEPSFLLEDLDPSLPTKTVEIGHKGKYVGLVGIYRDKKEYRLQYQAVLMAPEWETKEADRAGHPIVGLFENYTQELKRQDVLTKFPRNPHLNQLVGQNQKGLQATYVGSKRCTNCHKEAHAVWSGTAHFAATERLEKLKLPSGRQHDPECMKCHTTGMQNPGGYNDLVEDLANWPPPRGQKAEAALLLKHNTNLRGVGCESCHGPASLHVKDPENLNVRKLLNPFAPSPEERKLEALEKKLPAEEQQFEQLRANRLRNLSVTCMKCHDDENDVNWGKKGHEIIDKWIGKKLIHRTPREKANGPMIIQPPVPRIEVIEEKKN